MNAKQLKRLTHQADVKLKAEYEKKVKEHYELKEIWMKANPEAAANLFSGPKDLLSSLQG
jgi:hypothetical protein